MIGIDCKIVDVTLGLVNIWSESSPFIAPSPSPFTITGQHKGAGGSAPLLQCSTRSCSPNESRPMNYSRETIGSLSPRCHRASRA